MMQPAMRNYLGQILITAAEANQYELALGTRGRSGEQFDIWQAVYSPVGADGYPQPIFDKETGDIDQTVAAYWKEHYDLRYLLERSAPNFVAKSTSTAAAPIIISSTTPSTSLKIF